ncbi:zinc finger CCCH domain-containing protein 62-like isoform X2 [Carica papaya]|uniref:zinc finger CCCH domain-containing protein 62-like isoform X2 n=1 Tax=Carica papaya TaxID=3649 RepID=UPI000B8CE05E|nr:zinc finger CCCH domain-containing protein 62-like isoform X2 [Carica papaya]
MGISERGRSTRYQVIEDEDENSYSENAGSDSDSGSDIDPSYNIFEDTYDKFSNLSIKKKSKPRITKDPVELEDTSYKSDEKDPEEVHKIIEAGQLEKLKVEQCKIYLRKNGLRLTGNKETLIQRIKEHQEILNGGGENKYPVSSFVLNCKGDACTGDVVMFEQNVYEMFNIASRAATGPPCGTRTVAGRIVKESYGAAKQQHTFTIEVLWSKGEKPLAPLHPLLIKGRNLYRLKTLRQRWEDEGERQKILMEKHLRGSLARSDRELRIQEKERRKVLRATRIKRKNEPYNNQSQSKSNVIANSVIQFHQLGSSVTMGKAAPQQPGVSINPGNTETQVQKSENSSTSAE